MPRKQNAEDREKGREKAEKREVMANDRKVREAATYHSVALAGIGDERGGRYAGAAKSATTVVGATPIAYPKQPAGSPWAKDECPPEPSLGYSVDEIEPVGEMFERADVASTTVAPAVEVASDTALESRLANVPVADNANRGRVAPPKLKRRF